MNHKFYSSLVFSKQNFPTVHRPFTPRYNKEYFKRASARLDQLESYISRRSKNFKSQTNGASLSTLKVESGHYIKLKERFDKSFEKAGDETLPENEELLKQIESIEERLMPIALALPNRSSKDTPQSDIIEDEVKSDFMAKQNLAKVLSHTKLSYINNCYSKSVVGPNSYYYFGIGAKLQYGLSEYFMSELEKHRFVPASGLSLVKSAVVEACNSRDLKDYKTDPSRILTNKHNFTTMHLVEASRESLVGFLTSIGHISSNNPLRLASSGSGYKTGSMWFDSDSAKVTQFPTVHAISMCPSIEKYSMQEYSEFKGIVWNIYKLLELPARLVHCSMDSMISNEFDAYRIDIWLPSRQEWIECARVSHYLDYITVRTGMKRGHIIDSMVYDGQALVAAIIENKQTCSGKFEIPDVIREHIVGLDGQESAEYFKTKDVNNQDKITPPSNVLLNHEQRRYLVKKTYAFGHSEKSRKMRYRNVPKKLFVSLLILFCLCIDWSEMWRSWLPEPIKRILFDYIYRPVRRVWWFISYPQGSTPPRDRSYDETPKPKSRHEKQKEIVENFIATRSKTFGPDVKPGESRD